MEQINLFGDIEQVHEKEYLFIIKDDEVVSLPYEEIFDASIYDELYAITYVSSPQFFSKVVKDFKEVKIVLGIDNSALLSSFTNGIEKLLDIKERTDFWNSLDKDIKEKVSTDNISIRFYSDSPIHSKIYLLKNSQTGEKRVIIGSANLTETAFKNSKQYEDIMIFDNDDKKFDLYFDRRFSSLYRHSIDYIPEKVKKTNLKEAQIILLDKETATEILLNDLEKNRKIITLSDEQMAELKSRPQQVTDLLEFKKEEVQRQTSILSTVMKKKGTQYNLKPVGDLKKQIVPLQTLVSKSTKSQSEDIRQYLKYWEKGDTIYVVDKEAPDTFKPFSAPSSNEKIKNSLEMINKFIQAYKRFTFGSDELKKGYQSKIMEVLLFAFMSPFIWKLREQIVLDTSSESNRSTFPVILVIAGRAASGKTTVLELAGMLLGNNSPYYNPYSVIQKGRTVNKESLEGFFGAEYLSPILVDEVASSFFTGKTGENIIKDLSNNTNGKHPVLICTTNAREFNTSGQVLRRIYYIQVDSEFNTKEFNAESKRYLNEIKSQVNSELFKDFTYRVGQKIKAGEDLYTEMDCLYIARKVFAEYYEECGMDVPDWFPGTPFYDYEQRGKTIWRNLYINNINSFKEKSDGTIYVETDIFKSTTERTNCVNFLGHGCIKEDNQILLLDSQLFYRYIDIQPKKPFLESVINMFRG